MYLILMQNTAILPALREAPYKSLLSELYLDGVDEFILRIISVYLLSDANFSE